MVSDIIEAGPGALSSYYEWLERATPGQRLRYYLGNLASDRDPNHPRGQTIEGRRDIDALNSLANRVLADARQGRLRLFQRRAGTNVYEYLTDFCAPPAAAPAEASEAAAAPAEEAADERALEAA